MPLHRFRRQYEQLSLFERERIIGMIEVRWSARRVARQLGPSDCVVRRCWDQWIREMSFTRRPGSGCPRQTRPLDESRLNLSSDDNRVRVWRPRGEHLNPAFALQRHTAPTVGMMVWGAITNSARSPLIFVRSTITAQRYVQDILQQHVLPLMRRLPGAIFQQDNAQPNTTRVSQDCLRTVTTLRWPARSPNLSPIEHIWDHLGRRVGHPTSLNELEARLQQIQNEMSQDIIKNLYASMPDRIASHIRARGGSIGRHLDAFTRGRIIGKLEEGRSVTSVVAEFGIAHSIVSRLWRQFQTSGTAIRGFNSGRPRGTTPADDRRLHGGGLFERRPVRCVPLTPAHRRRRSLWCREHRNWRDNEWGRVLFTDESRFSLSSDSHRILIWRERGSRNHPSNIIERDRYGGRDVLVWGGIMLGSRTDLHIFDAGSVNGTRYCNEILLPYVRLFRGAMGLQFLFMDDNAPCHRTVAAEQLLESEDIERMDWPTRSPDLNPIEHVWDFLGRRLAARTLPPVTIRELRLALQGEWAAMPQQLIDTLILSMGRRCETCLAVRGDHIPY
ncbi:transposable element Tcb2 transposase [Trichonephila clavipes]|nr:transposable element Tcb2 transposase [Trichonephila clavipes]